MISYNEILAIHWVLINKFGGLHGLRDENPLKSAIERPFGGYGNNEFYPLIAELLTIHVGVVQGVTVCLTVSFCNIAPGKHPDAKNTGIVFSVDH